jgi:signal peptidase II
VKKKSVWSTAVYLALFIFFIDLASKFWVQKYLSPAFFWSPYRTIDLFHLKGIDFSIVHATNRGAAWGVLSQWQVPLLYFRLFLVCALAIYLFFINKKKNWRIPLICILVGALGNVVDFFLYGHVIDMFRFVFWGYEYPVFNVADSAICIGVIWLLILSWMEKPAAKKKKA